MVIRTDAVDAVAAPRNRKWNADDTILYALGVGAGGYELDLVTENSDGITLKALPMFSAVLGGGAVSLRERLGEFDPAMVVHGTQLVELHTPLSVAGAADIVGRVHAIADKGSGALIEIESTATDSASGEPLFTSTTGLFVRGEGGFGDAPGPAPRGLPALDTDGREPDFVIAERTSTDQALLYRLSGDRNRLHSDPSFARRAGFDRPILHGLCTWGFAGRMLGREVLQGRYEQCARFGGRFRSPVMPGDELIVEGWRVSDLDVAFRVRVGDRIVIDTGILSERPS
jgi:acyl dehydratase